jgi:hypothetical protein
MVARGVFAFQRIREPGPATPAMRHVVGGRAALADSPWENGYIESFNGKLRDELLNRKLFLSLKEARWVIDRWRIDYNHHRPHSGLDYCTPAAFATGCVLPGFATLNPPEHSLIF